MAEKKKYEKPELKGERLFEAGATTCCKTAAVGCTTTQQGGGGKGAATKNTS